MTVIVGSSTVNAWALSKELLVTDVRGLLARSSSSTLSLPSVNAESISKLSEKKMTGHHKPSQALHGQALLGNLIYNECVYSLEGSLSQPNLACK